MTAENVHILDTLTDQQILQEFKYLRSTITPNLKEASMVKDKDGQRRKVLFSREVLMKAIKNVLVPNCNFDQNIDGIVVSVLRSFPEQL